MEGILLINKPLHMTSHDANGKVVETKEFHGIGNLENVIQSFIGPQKQLPPMYSAIKVKGKKLYEYARNNEEVHVESRNIVINDIEIMKVIDMR